MSSYKKIQSARNGGPRYLKDGKFAPAALVPGYIKTLLEHHPGAEDWPVAVPCLFCGLEARHQRLVNQVTVQLCSKDYYSTRVGQIAQRLREIKETEDGLEAKARRLAQQNRQSKSKRRHVQRQVSRA